MRPCLPGVRVPGPRTGKSWQDGLCDSPRVHFTTPFPGHRQRMLASGLLFVWLSAIAIPRVNGCSYFGSGVVFCSGLGRTTFPEPADISALPAATDVTVINIVNNALTRVSQQDVAPYVQLEIVFFDSNPIVSVSAGWMTGLPAIRVINMNRCQLTSLPVNAFANSTTLEDIALRSNAITDIPAGAFNNLPNLVELDLSFNLNLAVIPVDLWALIGTPWPTATSAENPALIMTGCPTICEAVTFLSGIAVNCSCAFAAPITAVVAPHDFCLPTSSPTTAPTQTPTTANPTWSPTALPTTEPTFQPTVVTTTMTTTTQTILISRTPFASSNCTHVSVFLSCQGTSLTAVPAGLPGFVLIATFGDNQLQRIGANDFDAMGALLRTLSLENEQALTYIQPGFASALSQLTTLTIRATGIQELGTQFLSGVTSLQSVLIVVNSNLAVISANTFQSLPSLTSLSLISNRIDAIDSSVWSQLPLLQFLTLKEGFLGSIAPGTFTTPGFSSLFQINDQVPGLALDPSGQATGSACILNTEGDISSGVVCACANGFIGDGTFCSPAINPTTTPTTPPTSAQPTPQPSSSPTTLPTHSPTLEPTLSRTAAPTHIPSSTPTAAPTAVPVAQPTQLPSSAPSSRPSRNPTSTPTGAPTASPTNAPSPGPTVFPTPGPTQPPTVSPSTSPTSSPTSSPSEHPTTAPTSTPTSSPSERPTQDPTSLPSVSPSSSPSPRPSSTPTVAPTASTVAPTRDPTLNPSHHPTSEPTVMPSTAPTSVPTNSPTAYPSPACPFGGPDVAQCRSLVLQVGCTNVTIALCPAHCAGCTNPPTATPTAAPSASPTFRPSGAPTASPTAVPTTPPTPTCPYGPDPPECAAVFNTLGCTLATRSQCPAFCQACTTSPSAAPTSTPTRVPTTSPTETPTQLPTRLPTTTTPTQSPAAQSGSSNGEGGSGNGSPMLIIVVIVIVMIMIILVIVAIRWKMRKKAHSSVTNKVSPQRQPKPSSSSPPEAESVWRAPQQPQAGFSALNDALNAIGGVSGTERSVARTPEKPSQPPVQVVLPAVRGGHLRKPRSLPTLDPFDEDPLRDAAILPGANGPETPSQPPVHRSRRPTTVALDVDEMTLPRGAPSAHQQGVISGDASLEPMARRSSKTGSIIDGGKSQWNSEKRVGDLVIQDRE